jgi:hypothetical protein
MADKRDIRIMPKSVRSGGEVRLMGVIQGYAMIRRKGCTPFIVHENEWLSWPKTDKEPHP